jgi:hypothetical protein
MPGRSGRDEKQFGAPLGTETPSNATDRPKVGPADPDTQRRSLKAALNPPRSSTPAPAPSSSATPSPTKDLSVLGAAEKIQGRKAQIDQAIEDAGG